MKIIIVCFLFLRICLFAQNNQKYILTNDFVNIDNSLEYIIGKYINNESTVAIVFCYGVDFKKTAILNIKDSIYYERIDMVLNKVIKRKTYKFKRNNEFYDFIYFLKEECYFLYPTFLFIHHNGYRYYVIKNKDIIASFYSSIKLSELEIIDSDKSKFQLLYNLLIFLKIDDE